MRGKSSTGTPANISTTRPSSSASAEKADPAEANPEAAASKMETEAFREQFLSSLRKDFSDILRTEIRAVLEGEVAAIRSDIATLRAELNECRTELSALCGSMGGMEESLAACTEDVSSMQREVHRLSVAGDALQNKCDDLEAKSRRNNIRIGGVPESQSCSPDSVSALLKEAFELEEAPLLDRAHRSLLPDPGLEGPPRVIVAHLHYYQDCANILRLAREKQSVKVGDMTVSVFPDYTVKTTRVCLQPRRPRLHGFAFRAANLRSAAAGRDPLCSSPAVPSLPPCKQRPLAQTTVVDGDASANEEDGDLHVTIQRARTPLKLKRCTTCCTDFHCPFCCTAFFWPTKLSKVKQHLHNHLNRAVFHDGYTIHRCGLKCRPKLHYHCVYCQSMLSRKQDFIRHLAVCKKQPASVPTAPDPDTTTAPLPAADPDPDPAAALEPAAEPDPAPTSSVKRARLRPPEHKRCPVCSVVMNKKNLKKHIERKHAGKRCDAAAALPGQRADPENPENPEQKSFVDSIVDYCRLFQ